jgi:hypothetical protein
MILVLTAAAAALAAPPAISKRCDATDQWRLVFVNGPDGRDVSGKREDLLRAIRRGSPVRVGWGEAAADGKWSVEEYANTSFVNIMAGREVIAQIEPGLIQSSYIDPDKAGLKTPLVDWLAMIGTNGRFDAVTIDRKSGEQLRRLVQRTTVYWYALAPDPRCDVRPEPKVAPRGRLNSVELDEPSKRVAGE